jgi:hypothetical protein
MSDAAVSAPVAEVSDVSEVAEVSEVEGSGEESVEGGEETTELNQELAQKIKSLKLKIDGIEVEEEIPFEVTPEQAEWLKKELQLARAANKRMQEAAELRKKDSMTQQQIQDFLAALKENPIEILESMGIDTKDMSTKRLQEEIKKMEMSEEERKIAELQKELQELKSKEENARKKAEMEEQERLKSQYAAEYERDLMDAITKSNLPANPEIIQRMAQYMHTALKLGIDLNFSDIIPLVRESIQNDMNKLLGSLPVEEIMKVLGDENIQMIMGKKAPKPAKKAPVTPKDIVDTSTRKEKDDDFKPKFKSKPMSDFFSKL